MSGCCLLSVTTTTLSERARPGGLGVGDCERGSVVSSMLYTMGMALDRAHENGFDVQLLVEGQWVEGQVAANDGVGVVVECGDGMHCVVKADRISAVRVLAESPYRVPITNGAGSARRANGFGAAMPMPGPRAGV